MWTAFFTGFGELCESFFKILPKVGIYIDLIFIALAFIGTFYWIYYEYYVKKGGGKNYLSDK